METIHVLLIEDNRLLREGIAWVLNEEDDFVVVARSDDDDLVSDIQSMSTAPDIVLMDLGLEKLDSLKLMSVLMSEVPATKIVAMGIVPDEVDIVEFVKSGGSGFILKDAPSEDYVNTLRAVASGSKVLPSIMTKSLFVQIVETAVASGNGVPDGSTTLTPREKEVVELIFQGLSNKEIAEQLHIASFTVKSHVHNILEKLTLNSRLQVAAYAHKKRSP